MMLTPTSPRRSPAATGIRRRLLPAPLALATAAIGGGASGMATAAAAPATLRCLLVMALVSLGILTGPLVGSSSAGYVYGPYSSYSACAQARASYEKHGLIARKCQRRGSWAWVFKGHY